MSKQPAFQFYPGDWLKDTALRCCSAAARGIWMDLICMMYEAPQRGVLRTKSGQKLSPISIKTLSSSIAGCCPKLIQELIDNGVVRVARKDGALYSKRMIRDELKHRHWAMNGKKGGSKPKAKPKQTVSKTQASTQANRLSSSSSSTSVNNNINTTTTTRANEPPNVTPVSKPPSQELKQLVETWNGFARQKANADDIGIEYAYTQAVARWGSEAILTAIENYRQALLLPHSQAWDRPLGRLFLDIEKFIPGIFNLNNFDKTQFKSVKNETHKRDNCPGALGFR